MVASEQLKRLVDRIPDPDPDGRYAHLDLQQAHRINKVVDELGRKVCQSVSGLVALLTQPGQNTDVKARFALHLLAVYVTQKKNAAARSEFVETVVSQLGTDLPKAVQAYLIEQLQLSGTKAAVQALGKALLDPELCDTAARALVSIGDGAAEQLLAALPKLQGRSRVSVLQKLAKLRTPQAKEAFRRALGDHDPEARIAAAWGLARLADAQAAQLLLKSADSGQGWERINQTDACLTLAETLAAAGNPKDAAAIYAHLVNTRTDPSERHVRAAAQRGLAVVKRASG